MKITKRSPLRIILNDFYSIITLLNNDITLMLIRIINNCVNDDCHVIISIII